MFAVRRIGLALAHISLIRPTDRLVCQGFELGAGVSVASRFLLHSHGGIGSSSPHTSLDAYCAST